MKITNCRIACVPVINYITTKMLCRKVGDKNTSDIETVARPWTPIRRERSVYVQTEVITSDVKSDKELAIRENCDSESNDENKCDNFHCQSVSGEKISENTGVCENINKKDIVEEGTASESSVDDTNEDNITIKERKLSGNEEDVSNYFN